MIQSEETNVNGNEEMNFDAALAAIDEIDGSSVDLAGAEPGYPDFPQAEYKRRYARLQNLMDRAGIDALVLTQEENIRYLTGYNSVIWVVGRWLPTVFIATRDPATAVLVISAFDTGCARGSSWVPEIVGYTDLQASDLPATVAEELKSRGLPGRPIGMETGPGSAMVLPFDLATKVVAAAGDNVQDASRIMSTLRMMKSEAELDRVRRSAQAAVAGYRAALEMAKAGVTEKELVSACAAAMHMHGTTAGTRPTFLNCVAGPDRYSLVDSPASDRRLAPGDVVFLDGGSGCDGYMSDIIRMIGVGELTAEAERYAELASVANSAMLATVRPGVRASEVYEAGRQPYDDAGVGAAAGALFGHGIGMEVWERPFIRRHDDQGENIALRPGMTLCLEPILVPVGSGGAPVGIFVFEEQVAVTAAGYELLSDGLSTTLWRAPA